MNSTPAPETVEKPLSTTKGCRTSPDPSQNQRGGTASDVNRGKEAVAASKEGFEAEGSGVVFRADGTTCTE
jgi:hypothetical protein